jgi:hypothetical protein
MEFQNMNLRRFATGSVAVVLSVTTGCSVFVPSHQMMCIQSLEPHAKVWVNGAYQGEAPIQTNVMRNHSVVVVVKKEGYETLNKLVQYHLNTTGILDTIGTYLLLLPLIGIVSPGAHSLDETTLFFQLAPEDKSAASTNAPPATTQ